jgi:1-carboxybiuret hydrolase subunit AtzH-like protein
MSCGPVDLPDVVAEVREAHDRYEAALSRNDLDTLDALFWKDGKTIRFGPNGTLIGHASISAFRRGRSSRESRRVVLAQYITTFGLDFAVTNQETRDDDSGELIRQSQTWVRTEHGWRIVAAHVSTCP